MAVHTTVIYTRTKVNANQIFLGIQAVIGQTNVASDCSFCNYVLHSHYSDTQTEKECIDMQYEIMASTISLQVG